MTITTAIDQARDAAHCERSADGWIAAIWDTSRSVWHEYPDIPYHHARRTVADARVEAALRILHPDDPGGWIDQLVANTTGSVQERVRYAHHKIQRLDCR